MPSLTAPFTITSWEETPYDEPADGPRLARVVVEKAFAGELEGTSRAEVLMCQADPADYLKGAGFIGSEKFVGRLGDAEGSFVMQHGGISGGGQDPYTFGTIVPGSGTGALAGISGKVEFARTAEGAHHLNITYEL